MLAARGIRGPAQGRRVQHFSDEKNCRCPKNGNAHGPFHSAVIIGARMINVWKRQRPQYRERKESGANIEQFYVWNSFDQRLTELGTRKETIGVNDGMVEPFEKNESASHHDQPDGRADKHFLSQRC